MNWHKLVMHDLRCGLLRPRYLFVPFLAALPCFLCVNYLQGAGLTASVVDIFMYCFQGVKPIGWSGNDLEFRLPIFWLLLVGGCLFLNLDYLLKDLTNAGQQVIIRSNNRAAWYLSKCVWNVCSCAVYFFMILLTACLFAFLWGADITLYSDPTALLVIFLEVCLEPIFLSLGEGVLISFFLPLVTVTALSMLEMTLCLAVKPTTSFVGCMILLVVAMFNPSPWVLGNGAMTIRNWKIMEGGIPSLAAALIAALTVTVCAICGTIRFRHVDIVGLEE